MLRSSRWKPLFAVDITLSRVAYRVVLDVTITRIMLFGDFGDCDRDWFLRVLITLH